MIQMLRTPISRLRLDNDIIHVTRNSIKCENMLIFIGNERTISYDIIESFSSPFEFHIQYTNTMLYKQVSMLGV